MSNSKLWDNMGMRTNCTYFTNYDLTGDIIVISNSQENRQNIFEDLHRSLKVGLKLNMNKTKVISNNELAGQKIIIGNETLKITREIHLHWTNNYGQSSS